MKPAGENNHPLGDSEILKYLAPVGLRSHDTQFGPVFVRGNGARLWTENEELFLDLKCGYSANNFGHAFPPLVKSLRSQVSVLGHLTGDLHNKKLELAAKLAEIFGPLIRSEDSSDAQVIFNTGGARAVESAWKAAASFRPGAILSLGPGFHGRSVATSVISDTTKSLEDAITPDSYKVVRDSYPYCTGCPLKLTFPDCQLGCVSQLEDTLRNQASDISCVIVEPALGPRGYIFPPPAFFKWLRKLADETGILLVADEVQTGLGRCGSWLLCSKQGWKPDLLILGKSLGGGLIPISAVVGRPSLFADMPPGSESETFSATPLGCSIALTVLDQLANTNLMQRGEEIGATLRNACKNFLQWHDGIAIEGTGSCCVIELIACPNFEHISMLADEAFKKHKLLVHRSGPHNTRFVLLPPLTLASDELGLTLDRLESVFDFLKSSKAELESGATYGTSPNRE